MSDFKCDPDVGGGGGGGGLFSTSKCMHGMNQTEAEHPRQNKRSQTASLSQIGAVTTAREKVAAALPN